MTYPGAEGEMRLYLGRDTEAVLAETALVITADALRGLMEGARAARVSEPVARYAYQVVAATREDEAVALGLSPRAALAWIRAARARAFLDGRDYVLPDDLKAIARPALAHRLVLKGGGDAGALLERVLKSVPVEL
jgi:MoxR-like ATPase